MKDSCKLRCRKLLQPEDGVMETLKYSLETGALIVVILFAEVRKPNGLTAGRSVTAALIAVILFAGIRKSNGLSADRSVVGFFMLTMSLVPKDAWSGVMETLKYSLEVALRAHKASGSNSTCTACT
ncbi:hypothetical protein CEXT_188301 [Caerostris extrusa]|uniref:Uncharacterized protein n=1 Tax=Caerostris extrusa TaxID=172846 RepID=A0AAV4U7C5_CAEEX|nr:hypothetical protein CEXT_188301 [Caerostris extrusa]